MRSLLALIVIAVVVAAIVMLVRARRSALSQQRRSAWHAKRAEEDRIWYEKMGEDPPPER
ncbi:MAG: hypothetical protein ACTHM8_03770 [Sphingomonas sp.]